MKDFEDLKILFEHPIYYNSLRFSNSVLCQGGEI